MYERKIEVNDTQQFPTLASKSVISKPNSVWGKMSKDIHTKITDNIPAIPSSTSKEMKSHKSKSLKRSLTSRNINMSNLSTDKGDYIGEDFYNSHKLSLDEGIPYYYDHTLDDYDPLCYSDDEDSTNVVFYK